MTISEQLGLGGGPLVFDTPTLATTWQPVRRARRRPPPRDLELSTPDPQAEPRDLEREAYRADAGAVQRLLRMADQTRAEFTRAQRATTPTRKPARPARKEPTMAWSHAHQNDHQAAHDTVRPPSAEQEAWSRQIRAGQRGGLAPEPVTEAEDDYRARFPYGAGFDRRCRQLPSIDSVAHSRADLRRYEAARRSNFTDDASWDARDLVAATFDQDGNWAPPRPAHQPSPRGVPARLAGRSSAGRQRQPVLWRAANCWLDD